MFSQHCTTSTTKIRPGSGFSSRVSHLWWKDGDFYDARTRPRRERVLLRLYLVMWSSVSPCFHSAPGQAFMCRYLPGLPALSDWTLFVICGKVWENAKNNKTRNYLSTLWAKQRQIGAENTHDEWCREECGEKFRQRPRDYELRSVPSVAKITLRHARGLAWPSSTAWRGWRAAAGIIKCVRYWISGKWSVSNLHRQFSRTFLTSFFFCFSAFLAEERLYNYLKNEIWAMGSSLSCFFDRIFLLFISFSKTNLRILVWTIFEYATKNPISIISDKHSLI